MPTIRHVLFPLDFSAAGMAAIPYVRALANHFHDKLTVLSVVPPAWVTPPGLDSTNDRHGPGGAAALATGAFGPVADGRFRVASGSNHSGG